MNTWMTHQISNQFDEKQDYNLFETDTVLKEILTRCGSHNQQVLSEMGRRAGSAEYYTYADLANRHTPILHAFDARGRRKDVIEFHPAWHQWMALNRQFDTHAHPFNQPHSTSKWVEWATRFYLAGQVECGNLCPNSMTLGSIPLIQREPELWAKIGDKLLSTEYDERDVPIAQKKSIWFGMGMTEKQGGSDVRANETIAVPVAETGRGKAYLLTGHKWFFLRQCVMRIWLWPKPNKMAWLVFLFRAGEKMAQKIIFTYSASKKKSVTAVTPVLKLNLKILGDL